MYKLLFVIFGLMQLSSAYGQNQSITEQQLENEWNAATTGLPTKWPIGVSKTSYTNIMKFVNNLTSYMAQILPNPSDQQQVFMDNLLSGPLPMKVSYVLFTPSATPEDLKAVASLFKTVQNPATLHALIGNSSNAATLANLSFYVPNNLPLSASAKKAWNEASEIAPKTSTSLPKTTATQTFTPPTASSSPISLP